MPKQIADAGPHGGPTWLYRGVTIHANSAQKVFAMAEAPPGLPGKWNGMGSLELVRTIIDSWLDSGTLPPPYRVPGGRR